MQRSLGLVFVVAAVIGSIAIGGSTASAAWAGKNGKIAYSSGADGDREIWTIDASGSNNDQIVNHDSFDYYPSYSPNGKKICFESLVDGDFDIYVVGHNGGVPQQLTNDPGTDFECSWSADGKQILFVSDRQGFNTSNVYIMTSKGTHERALTHSPGGIFNEYPQFSPNGELIAFDGNRNATGYDIYTMNEKGNKVHHLTNDPGDDTEPGWTPDGRRIGFTSDRGSNNDLWIMARTGKHEHVLLDMPNNAFSAAFSPNGKRLAFTYFDGSDYEIYAATSRGLNPVPVTSDPGSDSDPDWGPKV